MATSFFDQFGLNFDPQAEADKSRRLGVERSLGLINGISPNPGVQGAANIGALLGAGLSSGTGLTQQQQRMAAIQEDTNARLQRWMQANPDASEEDKAQAAQDLAAQAAVAGGRADIGSAMLAQNAAAKRARQIQQYQLELLGYQNQEAKTKAAEAQRGDIKTVWMRGEKDPSKGFDAIIDPVTGDAIDAANGKRYPAGAYTRNTPLDPERSSVVRAMIAAQKQNAAQAQLLDPATLNNAVIDTLSDPARIRNYASYGAAGQAIRTQINEATAQYLKDAGMTRQEAIRQQAVVKSSLKSIDQLVPMKDAITAYETLARGNGVRILDLAEKLNGSPVGLVNSGVVLAKAAVNDPDARELMLVLRTYQTEVARIVANPRLTGVLSDTARKEIENVVPGNMTIGAAVRLVNRLNVEFDLRNKGVEDAISQAQGRLNFVPQPGQQPAPAQPAPAPSTAPDGSKIIDFTTWK